MIGTVYREIVVTRRIATPAVEYSFGRKHRQNLEIVMNTGKTSKSSDNPGFSEEERAAMKERAQELKKEKARGKGKKKADGEADVMEKINEMEGADREIAERLHALIKEAAPDLAPRTWYGMPAYSKDGKVICFFQSAGKWKTRYATLGFSEDANLDDGNMWPVAFGLKQMGDTEEEHVRALLKRAVD